MRNFVSPLFLQRENFISFQAFPLGVGFESQTFCLPPGGKVAPKGPDEGAVLRLDSLYAGGNFAAKDWFLFLRSPVSGGDLLCPWRLVVAKSACLRFRLTAKTATAPLLLLFPANPLRWASPGVRERLTKTPPGTAQDERSALIFAFPRPPLQELSLWPGIEFPARKI